MAKKTLTEKALDKTIEQKKQEVADLKKQVHKRSVVQKIRTWHLKKKVMMETKKEKEAKKKKKVQAKRRRSAAERRRTLNLFLEKAGIEIEYRVLSKSIFNASIVMAFLLSIYLMVRFSIDKPGILYSIIMLIVTWSFGFLLILMISWGVFHVYLDMKIYQRRKEVEEVLPDFLQLTSANIRAGMPIDRALWFAVRPRFGVLAKEIEDVAKRTLVGEELYASLHVFTEKFDSLILSRSINLLIEGIEAGGEVGELLDKIANDIQESRIMRKEMAANVTTYVIFITFASIVAAPFMFGLAYQLLTVIHSIVSTLDMSATTSSMGMGFNVSADSISLSDFRTFSMVALSVTALFSSMIISVIKKGNITEGLRYIPTYILISLLIYMLAVRFLGVFMSGLI